jgi:hypothetical protein
MQYAIPFHTHIEIRILKPWIGVLCLDCACSSSILTSESDFSGPFELSLEERDLSSHGLGGLADLNKMG